jgi:7-carboxy-7-deazaguanine synthase
LSSLRVTEIFYSIQGESCLAGSPCVFVRLTGCPLRCRWCDTSYAFSGGEDLSEDEVLRRVASFACRLVEVTGGEPLAQGGSLPLIRRLCEEGYQVLLETSGGFPIRPVDPRARIIMDLKCPDSGEMDRNLWENLDHLKAGDEIKFVLCSRRDYEWARQTVRERALDSKQQVLFSPVTETLAAPVLAGWILADRLPVRLQLQLHKILFGAEARGV